MINPRYSLGHGDWFVPYDMRKHYGEELLDAVNKHEPNPLIKRGIPLEEQTIKSVEFTKGNYLPKPSVGRIVHYTHAALVGDNGEGFPEIDLVTHAAMILTVGEGYNAFLHIHPAMTRLKELGSVDEYRHNMVEPPLTRDHYDKGTPFSPTPKPGCWSWPPRD